MKKTLLTVLIVLVFSLTGCKKENEKITVVLDWTPNTNHTGLYVAKELGYFEDAGLDVDIVQPNNATSETLVGSNTAQFGISAEENTLGARAAGIPVVSIAAIIYENSSGFISKKSSSITSPKDFENKTYCGWGMDTETEIIQELVKADGGDFSKVNITTNYLDIFTDVNNDCDFFWVFEAWQVEQAKLQGVEYNYLSMTDYSEDLDFHTPVLITNEDMIKDNKDTVQAFVDAFIKGYEYSIEHPAKSADILIKHAPELNEELVQASQLFISTIYQKEGVSFGVQSVDYWTNFNSWLNDKKIVEGVDVTKAYTNEFVNE
jgi:ABC-type nitrate/sulfonate/bicarbonate transport system substrate-binding protein